MPKINARKIQYAEFNEKRRDEERWNGGDGASEDEGFRNRRYSRSPAIIDWLVWIDAMGVRRVLRWVGRGMQLVLQIRDVVFAGRLQGRVGGMSNFWATALQYAQ